MFRRLFHRNVALLVAVVLAGQLLAGFLVMTLVIRPQVIRVAAVTADMVTALSQAMRDMDPARQAALIDGINRAGSMAVRPAADVPSDGPRFPTMVERQFTLTLASRLHMQDELVWRTDKGGRLWFLLRMGQRDYWVSITPPRQRGALASLMLASFVAFVIAIACGLALQRRIDRPLRQLARSVDGYRADGTQPPLDVSGPAEVAAVAGALNRMTARIAGQEAERALMLAGVSHDLRTPLTRLRLSLEMLRGQDEELEGTALRQVDRIEAMLTQFLDFGRGFENEAPVPTDVAGLLAHAAADAGLAGTVLPDVAPNVATGLVFTLRPQAVARAVANLLSNAARHGMAPIRMDAVLEEGALRITVSDAGAGIAPTAGEQMLRPFARGDSARGGEGTGLGLAIVSRVAAAHNGTVTFGRRNGRFAITLLLRAA